MIFRKGEVSVTHDEVKTGIAYIIAAHLDAVEDLLRLEAAIAAGLHLVERRVEQRPHVKATPASPADRAFQ